MNPDLERGSYKHDYAWHQYNISCNAIYISNVVFAPCAKQVHVYMCTQQVVSFMQASQLVIYDLETW